MRERTRRLQGSTAGRRRAAYCALFLSALLFFSGCGSGKPELPPTKVTIQSSPEQGAEVVITGTTRGVTPVTLEGLEPGFVDVLLKKDNYKRTQDRIQVIAGQPQEFTIELEPLLGYVNFESTPEGAEILLDGQNIGKTPLHRHPVRIGQHTYEMQLTNHHPVSGALDIEVDFEYTEKQELKGIQAKLQVTSRPSGATIWLNEQQQVRKSPASFDLPPGEFIVAVYTEGHVREEGKIVLGPNEEKVLNLVMKEGNAPAGMLLVAAGEFTQGADDSAPEEKPMRKVDIPAFYIDKYEVTNEDFKKVFPKHTFPEGQENFPAAGVNWNQAEDYARAVKKRLPTESEWEKAARGTEAFQYPWGKEFELDRCNSAEADKGGPVRVGSMLTGGAPGGCMDMAGNVYEWVQDLYGPYPGNTEVNIEYGQVFRVLRGGSYKTDKFDIRTSARHFDKPDAKKSDYGFRCAMDLE